MDRECVQCGEKFTVTESEADFYKSKNLNLPKRCKNCRDFNKAINNANRNKAVLNSPAQRNYTHGEKAEYKTYYKRRPFSKRFTTVILPIIIALAAIFVKAESTLIIVSCLLALFNLVVFLVGLKNSKVLIREFDTALYKHTFYNTESMVEHYVKHGQQTNCASMEDYLCKANIVVADKASKTKIQKKDGDRVYYNPKTSEFVVIAKAGYLRTYFIANNKYYNKQ